MQLVRPSQLGRIGGRASGGGDVTAPTLSLASAGTPTSDGATNFGVTTNEGNGTLYWAVVTNGGSCTDTQLKAGAGGNIVAGKAGSQAVTGTGAQTVASVTGLTSSTTYQIKYLHRDAAGNDSSQASVSLTTTAAALTWNPSDKSALITLSGGNLVATHDSTTNWGNVRATAGKATGKWYWEVTATNVGASFAMVGVANSTMGMSSPNYLGIDTNGWGYYATNGNKSANGFSAYGATWTTGDVIGVALDMDNGKIWFSKNGTWQASGDPAAGTNPMSTGLTGTLYPTVSEYLVGVLTANFGASAFAYTPPTGFSAVGP